MGRSFGFERKFMEKKGRTGKGKRGWGLVQEGSAGGAAVRSTYVPPRRIVGEGRIGGARFGGLPCSGAWRKETAARDAGGGRGLRDWNRLQIQNQSGADGEEVKGNVVAARADVAVEVDERGILRTIAAGRAQPPKAPA